MHRSFVLALAALLVLPAAVRAQEEKPAPCSAPEARQMDFWVGDWNLTWKGGTGTNHVRSILGGCVIEENFTENDSAGTGLVGHSYSVYNQHLGKWQQTWVDNQGTYLDFAGGKVGDTVVLSRQAERKGKRFLQRMVFSNIGRDAFDWSWDRSDDDGKTWKPLWVIHYARVPE